MAISMNAYKRMCTTKSELRKLRQNGQIPGIIYGKQVSESAPISVDLNELMGIIKSNPNAVLEMDIPDYGKHAVMISEVQRDMLNPHVVIHVDFHQVSMNEKVRANVRIEIDGDSKGVREGGILSVILHELEIQCMPSSMPEVIHVDISSLGIGESLLVRDLQLPQGALAKSEPDLVVATILAPQKELSEEEAHDAAVESEKAEAREREAELKELKTF